MGANAGGAIRKTCYAALDRAMVGAGKATGQIRGLFVSEKFLPGGRAQNLRHSPLCG